MGIDIVLNDRSITIAADQHQAHTQLLQLIQTMQTVGGKNTMRLHQPIYTMELAPNYYFHQWINEPEMKGRYKNQRTYIMSMATKSPYLQDHPQEASLTDKQHTSEFMFKQQTALGLGMAVMLDGIAISLASHSDWDNNQLTIEEFFFDDSGELAEKHHDVLHHSSPQHIQQNKPLIEEINKRSVRDGRDAYERCSELFPDLEWTETALDALKQLEANDQNWPHIKRHLFQFQAYAANWQTGTFDKNGLKLRCSTESKSTMNLYSHERIFRCSDGKDRLFEWHSKLSDAVRIHFLPDGARYKIIIGYIGKHLSI
ncbi:hypothetical protein [Herpetosiphon sp. NSE202]|uniref:hypothetical protein n=1 Tax=Herpetosiphon sp. NSE202 TaxID=3351349 RepID=UPI003629FDA1